MKKYSKVTFPEKRSIPFIYESQKGLQIHKGALQYLSGLPSKNCHILTIVGRAKTGKSTLMNHLVHRLASEDELEECFPVSDCLGGGTKGINILTNFVELDNQNILLFLDVEGLGRFTNSENYQSKLFAVSLLLSTTLIYNSIGPIDEQALQNLSFFIEIGKMFEKSLPKCNSSFQLPSLFMVLRDFSLKLQNKQGIEVTAKEYLENALEEQKGTSQVVFHKNRIRRTIKELFRQRNCETLVLPSDELPLQFSSQLRTQFQKDLSRLSSRLFDHVNQSEIGHRMLMPNEIILYLGELLQSVNTNVRVPKFESILANVFKKQIIKVKDQFKESVYKLSREFDKQAFDIQQIISNVKICGDFQANFVDDQISKLEKLNQSLNQSYINAKKEIKVFLAKANIKDQSQESYKNQCMLDAQELKILQSTKNQKQEEINKKIQDLRQIAALHKKSYLQQQLEKEQAAQFQKIIEGLCLIEDEKQLQKRYRSFIYTLRDKCSKVSSKQFESGLLKCEIAYLRRKLDFKDRSSSNICPSCKQFTIEWGKTTNETVLKDKLNTTTPFMNQMSFSSNFKNTANMSKEIENEQINASKSFYVPYIILDDPTIMNVQIIRTLIKQDSKLNNYIEYVLEVIIMEKRWVFNRKWKDFNELHSILTSLFHQIELPAFDNAHFGFKTHLQVHKQEVEDRRQKLQQYLRSLLRIQSIRNSRIMQKFLKINKQYVPTL